MRLPAFVVSALLACTTAVAAPANYRFSALIDIDRDVRTGCGVEAAGAAGIEWRVSALTDRAQIGSTVLEFCRDGVWEIVETDRAPRALALGQGVSGSDAIEWSLSRQWFAAQARLPIQIYAERLDRPAVDALAQGDRWQILDLALIDSALAVPLLSVGGVLALMLVTLLIGRRDMLRRHLPAGLAVLLISVLGLGPPSARADGEASGRVTAIDAGNDVADAGADLLRVQVHAEAERIQFRAEVNNIEYDALIDHAKVLFIGNSLTYSNDLPDMLEAVARQAGKDLETDAITIPGGALEDHFRARTAHAALATGGYQIVILQQGPSSLPESQANLREWTRRFEARIRAGGARPALYMVWPDSTRLAFFDDVRESYSNAALDVRGMFIPAGEAWRAAWRLDPDLPLYDLDQFHPSPLGSYVAALSMFAELYRQTPEGLPAELTLADGLNLSFDPEQARTAQTAAWQAHLAFGRAGE